MAYSIDGTDLLINGWENGISDNPYKGINDMRGVNIISTPGEASVSFAQTNKILPPVAATITSVDIGNDTITVTVTNGSLVNGQAVIFDGTPPTGITVGQYYWISGLSGNTFSVYDNPYGNGTKVNLTAAGGSSTILSTDIKDITYFEKTSGAALDSAGRVWKYNTASRPYYIYLGNPVSGTVGLSNTVGNGLIYYRGYLFVFYNSRICYTPYSLSGDPSSATWVNEWDPATGAPNIGVAVFNTATGVSNPHEALTFYSNDKVYITDANYIASLVEYPGKTFDPTDPTTYIWNKQDLVLPKTEIVNCLAPLGSNLLIGGSSNVVYSWDRASILFNNAMMIVDNYIAKMVTVNTNTYIFAGKRGRIYVTNGSQANLYAKVPDHISGVDPIFTWKNCCYNKNQLYFGVSVQNNAGTTINTYAGLWAIDVTTNAMRVTSLQSDPLGTVTAVYADNSGSGFGLFVAWKNGTTYGIDTSTSTPYSTYVATIETDIIPVGQYLRKRTFTNLEFKLSAPLVSGEGVKISYRTSKSGTYVVVGETLNVGAISDAYLVNFDQSQWLQFKIELKSTATNPSYTRFYELRLR